MVKYEPNFFVFPREKKKQPEDKKRNTPAVCQNEPLGVGVLAMGLLNTYSTQEQKDMLILEENKSQILPDKLQKKVNISMLKNGILILSTTSSVWRSEIMAIKSDIIAACNKILGKIAVKTLRI
jgi:hypothetical protein